MSVIGDKLAVNRLINRIVSLLPRIDIRSEGRCFIDPPIKTLPFEDTYRNFGYVQPDTSFSVDHIGFDLRDHELEDRVRELGISSRNDIQVLRLALREAVVTDRTVHPGMAAHLVERYNLT